MNKEELTAREFYKNYFNKSDNTMQDVNPMIFHCMERFSEHYYEVKSKDLKDQLDIANNNRGVHIKEQMKLKARIKELEEFLDDTNLIKERAQQLDEKDFDEWVFQEAFKKKEDIPEIFKDTMDELNRLTIRKTK